MKTVLGIILKDKRILIGKLKEKMLTDFGELKYVFPGGKIEDNETNEEAVVREILEETGLKVKVIQKIGDRIHPKTNKHIEYYHCEVVSGSEVTKSEKNDDIESLQWVELDELNDYMPTLFPIVEEYLKSLLDR